MGYIVFCNSLRENRNADWGRRGRSAGNLTESTWELNIERGQAENGNAKNKQEE